MWPLSKIYLYYGMEAKSKQPTISHVPIDIVDQYFSAIGMCC